VVKGRAIGGSVGGGGVCGLNDSGGGVRGIGGGGV